MIRSNIRKIMENKGMSYRELELQSGITLKTIHKARQDGEGRIESCTLSTLSRIAKILNVQLKELFDEA